MEQIGRYEITGELGKGAMGVVYKAIDPTIGRVVALKTMRLDVSGMEDGELLHRFRNEARSAGMLNHPNLVTVYDAGEQSGLFYIAMEYIEGQTLQSLLVERHVLPVEQVISISTQVCAGLDYAHSRNVVHRDIKPANVMLAADGTVKIMDFGIAKFGGGVTSTGQVLGTPNYMSPEQVKGKPLDGRSDLFGLGVMLYEMLTGEKPFVGQNVTTIIYKIVNETPIPPRELDVTIHPGLSAVVTRALSKAPDERYQTGAELARDLRNYKSFGSNDDETLVLNAATLAAAAAGPGPARSPMPKLEDTVGPSRKLSPARSRRIGVYALTLALVVIAISTAGAVFYARGQRQQMLTALADTLPPAPSPPAAPAVKAETANVGTGELRILSVPPGAALVVDGRTAPEWVTPFTLRLKAGSHAVTLSKPGFVSEIRSADVQAGKRARLEVELPSSRPRLVVKSQPAGAEIFVDDKSTGMLTPAEVVADAGRHTLLLRKAGFEDATTPADLSEGQRFSFAPKLRARPAPEKTGSLKRLLGTQRTTPSEQRAGLVVRTHPKGAEVLINGFVAARRTPFRFSVRPGKYELLLRLEGYKAVKKKIEIGNRQTLELNETLERE